MTSNITPDPNAPILVLGGTGKTGRRVAGRLTARGLPVRLGSRSATPPFDWDRPGTWDAVLTGVRAAYIAYAPDISVPGAAATIGAFAGRAVAHGVRRLVLLSGRGMDAALPAERAVRDAGAAWTILRCDWFAQIFSEEFLRDLVLAGELALPTGGQAEPFIDAEDIADVAVAALLDETGAHAGRVWELTGPRALTIAEAAAEIAGATGRDIRYVPVSPAEFVEGMVAGGVPADVAGMVAAIFTETFDGRNAKPTDDVRRVLGRAPRDFADYVRRAAGTGVWQANGHE